MKNISLPLSILFMLLSAALAYSNSDGQPVTIDTCNRLYYDNNFTEAINCYEELAGNGFSAALFFNIGNSYAQLDHPGYSVLYYLRALSLAPGDSDISGNLSMVRKEYSLFPAEKPAAQKLFETLTLGQWSLLCLISLAAYLIFSCTRISRSKNLAFEFLITGSCLLVFTVGVTGTVVRYKALHQSVVVQDSRLLISPYDNGASVGSIEQGRLVSPRKQYGSFWYVTDETGRKGWLKSGLFEPILVESSYLSY